MHPVCTIEGCGLEENRDGLCFKHKIKTLRFGTEEFARARRGGGPGLRGDETDREYVRNMYEARRKSGLPDPIPANKKAAALAPAAGPMRGKKYKEANNGL
jgi:hypothetical protein